MSWTFVDSDGANGAGSSTTIASPGLTVNVGDLVVVMAKWEGADTTVSFGDGTSTLTPWSIGNQGTTGSNNEPHLAVAYILASVASGTNSVVYTATFGATRAFRDIIVMVFTPSAACSVDGSPNCNAGNSGAGTGTTLASGNITTSGTDGIAFGAYAEYGATLLSDQINGVALAHSQTAGTASTLYNITYASGFTGQATGQFSSANRWVLGVIAFKVGGGGGPTVTYPELERSIRGLTRGITPGLARAFLPAFAELDDLPVAA